MKMTSANPFSPDFGRPPIFYGRRRYVSVIEDTIRTGIRPNRSVLIEGIRGTGKTALLCHLRDLAEQRDWDAIYVTSVDAANSISHDLARLDGEGRSVLGAGLTIAGFGGSFSMEGRRELSWQPTVRQALVDHMERSKKGLIILIDEMQKITRDDAQAICDAVITARTYKDDVALVMAGLPGTLNRLKSFSKCTYMVRSTFMFLTMLSIKETHQALGSSFRRVRELSVPTELLEDMVSFTKGHPYLVQLVGYNVYRSVERMVESEDGVCLPVEVTQEMVSAAKEAAYESYAAKILSMLFENLGSGTMDYLRAIAATMDENGIMRSDQSIADALGKKPESISSYRTRLKRMGLLEDPKKGQLTFRIPYVKRFLEEGTLFTEDELDDGEEYFPMT